MNPHRAWLLLPLLLVLLLHVPGMRWGLPTAERTALSYRNPDTARQLLSGVSPDDLANSWQQWTYQEDRSRSNEIPSWVFNPIRSYHADEHNIFKSISNMKPQQLDFNPHFFVWGTFYFYLVAAALAVAKVLSLITVVGDVNFYIMHPEKFAELYLVGRTVSLLLTLGTVAGAMYLGRQLGSTLTALFAGLFTVLAPLLLGYGHFMTTDPALAAFFTLALVLAVRTWQRGGTWRDYLLAGAAIGLAAGAKYNGALVCTGLITAHLLLCVQRRTWRDGQAHLRLLAAGGMSLLAFLAVTPYAVLAWPEFSDQLFTKVFGALGSHGAVPFKGGFFLTALATGTQIPVLLLAVAGALLALRRQHLPALIPAATCLLYFAYFLKFVLNEDRMMLPLVAPVAALAAYALFPTTVLSVSGQRTRLILALAVLVLLIPMAAAVVNAQRGEDPRLAAGHWVRARFTATTTCGLVTPLLQYHQPPMDYTAHRFLPVPGLVEDYARLSAEGVDYVILNLEENRSEWPEKMAALNRHHRYAVVAAFGTWDEESPLICWLYKLKPLRTYLWPRLVIYRRSAATD